MKNRLKISLLITKLLISQHIQGVSKKVRQFARCGYALRVTSQTYYSPEYTTPTQKKFILLEHIGIEGTRYCSEISLTRTVLTA